MAASVNSDWQDIPAPASQPNGGDWQDIAAPAHHPVLDALATVARNPLDVVNAPFQVAGEAMRMPIEGDGNFRAPTILQKLGWAGKTDQPPADPFHVANALIRGGLETARTGSLDAGRQEYHRDAGLPGAIQDTVTALASGKIAPEAVNAPVTMLENLPGEVADAAAALGKKAIRFGLGPTEDATAARFANPAAVTGAKSQGEIADLAAETANRLKSDISEADNNAWKTLGNDYLPPEEGGSAIPKSDVLDLLKKAKQDLSVHGGGVVGKAAKQASAALDGIASDVQDVGKFVGGYIKSQQGANSSIRLNNFLPESTVKGIVQALDQNINWDNPELGPVNRALEQARVSLDTTLKNQNPAYAAQMDNEVAPRMQALTGLTRKFNLKNEVGNGLVSTDTTASKVKSLGSGRDMPETERVTQDVANLTGTDLQNEAQLSNYKEQFRPGRKETQGSRRAVTGGVVGEGVGHFLGLPPFLGGTLGAMGGAALDYYGGDMAGKLIDAASKGNTAAARLLAVMQGSGVGSSTPVSAIQQLAQHAYAYGPGLQYADQNRR